MNRSMIAAGIVAVVATGVIAYQMLGNDSAPPLAVVAQPAEAVPAAPAQSSFPPPTPAVPVAPPTPVEVPAPIVKQLAMSRAAAPSRPMTQLAKSWFGCTSAEGYNATLLLIREKSSTSKDHFKGSAADCVPLASGTHIKLMHLDDATGQAQISIVDTNQVVWTDSGALAGDLDQK